MLIEVKYIKIEFLKFIYSPEKIYKYMEEVFYIIGGFLLLLLGGDFLVKSSVGLSFKFNISKMVIGMTVVSIATSAPELLVSLQAAIEGHSTIAVNNVIGSNIANIGFILGVTTIIAIIKISKDFLKFDWPVMVVFSLLIHYFMLNDNKVSRVEGIILCVLFIIFLIILIKRTNPEEVVDEVDEKLANISFQKIFLWLLIAVLALYYGSEFLVNGAKSLALKIGVSEAVISVTLLGNLVGSNIFNIGGVLGLTAVVKEIPIIEPSILSRDIFWMLIFAISLLPLAFLPKKLEIGRYKGLILFLSYIYFIYLVYFV